ncbi:hypothetical protein [Streptomyces sp. t39]|uniref:hypothetical protein n=1 Tax=Streptomyces sp. t39 TaxID=1828156 RepID=UPI0011CD6428|nr:hypothetical protein [Streptomyces sp. t39]TXS42934.1 hypothetical protein EAO77_35345 [Streptomyces sp. t39]
MAAQLKGTVYVTDPDTRQTVTLAAGSSPEPRLAALVTNPAAWVDGKLPRLAKMKAENEPGDGSSPSGDGPDGASGDDSDPSGAADPQAGTDGDKPTARKTTARKTAARKPADG